jgi:hypothetical protein
MTTITAKKGTDRYNFIEEMIGPCHTTVHKDGKVIGAWQVEKADAEVMENMLKESNVVAA